MLYSDMCEIVLATKNPFILLFDGGQDHLSWYKAYGCMYDGFPTILLFTPTEYKRAVTSIQPREDDPLNVIQKEPDGAYTLTVICSDGSHKHRLRVTNYAFKERISYRINTVEQALNAGTRVVSLFTDITKLSDSTTAKDIVRCKEVGVEGKYWYFEGACEDHAAMVIQTNNLELITTVPDKTSGHFKVRRKLHKRLGHVSKKLDGHPVFESFVKMLQLVLC